MSNEIHTTLTLRRAIWNKELRASIINKVLTTSSQELVDRIKDNIDNSTPAGRLYSRGSVTARSNRTVRGTKTRVIITPAIFRSSGSGQPPARRFNTLYNSVKAKRVVGKLQILASVNAPGVKVLDNPSKLNRPFFRSVIKDYRHQEFFDKVKQSVRELLS